MKELIARKWRKWDGNEGGDGINCLRKAGLVAGVGSTPDTR